MFRGPISFTTQSRKRGLVAGCVKVARGAPSISHLLFADDLLIFARAKGQDSEAVQRCLEKYMSWSMKKINKEKSSIHFSSNFQGQQLLSILDYFGLKKLPAKAKHLGLPFLIPRSKGMNLKEIKQKFMGEIAGWQVKFLSQAGRSSFVLWPLPFQLTLLGLF